MFNSRLKSLIVLGVVGLFLFLTPIVIKAEELPRDVLIKGPGKGTAVYYLAFDDRRYVFPNQHTYLTWFKDFSDVYEVTPEELANFPLGGNVTYRPGVRMVKITTDPQVYAVDQDACLRWVTSEDVAIELYGTDWNTKIDDVPDAFFVDYQICDPIYSALYYQPIVAALEMTSINSLKTIATSGDVRIADTIPDVGDATPRSCTPSEDITKSGLSVFVDETGLPTESFMLLDGSFDVLLGEVGFTSDNEALKIFSLSVSVDPVSILSGMRLYDGNQQVSGSVAVDSSGRAIFTDVDFTVSKLQTKTLTIKGDIKPFGQGGVQGGQKIRITLDSSYFMAESALPCSSTVISGGIVLGERLPLTTRDRVIRQTRPIVSLEPLSSEVLSNNQQSVLRFNLEAEQGGDMAFRRLVVPITGEFQEIISLRLAEYGNLRRVSDDSLIDGEYRLSGACTSVKDVSCVLAITLDKWEMVLAGESQSYDVLLEAEGILNTGDYLNARLESDMSSIQSNDYPAISTYNFAWSDTPYVNNNDVSVHGWANGAHVSGLPTVIQTLIR